MKYPYYSPEGRRGFPVTKFSSAMKVWAMEANVQLRAAFDMQKMWNGTRANSVWVRAMMRPGKSSAASSAFKKRKSRQKRKTWSWYEESKRREKAEARAQAGHGAYWYSTGYTRKVSNVKVLNATMGDGTIDFHTTSAALFAEAGVGLNGPQAARGARARKGRKRIKVDRHAPWTHTRRYVGQWQPSLGKTHRPNMRQQMSLYKRRIGWLARTVYLRDLTLYMAYTMDEAWRRLGQVTL